MSRRGLGLRRGEQRRRGCLLERLWSQGFRWCLGCDRLIGRDGLGRRRRCGGGVGLPRCSRGLDGGLPGLRGRLRLAVVLKRFGRRGREGIAAWILECGAAAPGDDDARGHNREHNEGDKDRRWHDGQAGVSHRALRASNLLDHPRGPRGPGMRRRWLELRQLAEILRRSHEFRHVDPWSPDDLAEGTRGEILHVCGINCPPTRG